MSDSPKTPRLGPGGANPPVSPISPLNSIDNSWVGSGWGDDTLESDTGAGSGSGAAPAVQSSTLEGKMIELSHPELIKPLEKVVEMLNSSQALKWAANKFPSALTFEHSQDLLKQFWDVVNDTQTMTWKNCINNIQKDNSRYQKELCKVFQDVLKQKKQPGSAAAFVAALSVDTVLFLLLWTIYADGRSAPEEAMQLFFIVLCMPSLVYVVVLSVSLFGRKETRSSEYAGLLKAEFGQFNDDVPGMIPKRQLVGVAEPLHIVMNGNGNGKASILTSKSKWLRWSVYWTGEFVVGRDERGLYGLGLVVEKLPWPQRDFGHAGFVLLPGLIVVLISLYLAVRFTL